MADLLPEPMSQTEQRAQRLMRLESFFDGLDTVDAKLDPASRGQFAQMLEHSDNPQEARASAVNQAYIAYTQPQAREAIETNWPHVRQQAAQSLGINKPEVTDSELYSAIGAKVKESRDNRQIAHELGSSIQLAALAGDGDWLRTFNDFVAANKKPGGAMAHIDEFRQVAEAAYQQIAARAHVLGPVVKEVSGLLTQAKDDPNPIDSDETQRRREAMINAIMKLDKGERSFAIVLAAQKVAREGGEVSRGGLEKAGEAVSRGVQAVSQGVQNQLEAFFADQLHTSGRLPADVRGELAERRQVMRELANVYRGTVDPIKGQNIVTQGMLNITGMLPQLGLITNPAIGIPLILAHAQDARQGELETQGVPREKAALVGLAQGTIDTALQFVTSNMVMGRIAPGGAGILGTAATTADLLKKVATIGAIETGTMAGVTVAQAGGPLAVQELASLLSKDVPEVDWTKEFDAFKHALPETIATLVPMVLLGTGAATFRELHKFREFSNDVRTLEAVGFSEEQARKLVSIADPMERLTAIQSEWGNRQGTRQAEAVKEIDQQAEAKKAESLATITRNEDGTYKVENADGSITLDGIADPAEAQRAADSLTEREGDPAKAITKLAEAIKPLPTGETPGVGEKLSQIAEDSRKTGIAAPMPDWLRPVANRIRETWHEITSLPNFGPFKQALNRWVGRGQIASLEIRQTTRQIERAVPRPEAREGITAWLQADGDRATLARWAKDSTHLAYKRGYEAALKLTPAEIRVAERIRDFYRDMLITLQDNGIVDHGVENYVSQIWERENPVTGKEQNPAGPRLVKDLKHAKERVFGSYFEGEEAGFKPVTKDISKLLALYANSVSKVIATREFIRELTTKKASDGRPLAAPFGNRALTTATEGDPVYIKPLAKDTDTLDYRTIEGQPALTKWKWIGEHEGADAYMEGQLGLHPEIFTHVRNALGKSIIREWYAERHGPLMQTVVDTAKLVDKIGQVTKGTMLGFFSPFHVVQEGTHAVGHHINPFFNLPDLNPADPLVRNAVTHGLMLAGDGEGMRHFKDSIDANLTSRLPVIGKLSQQFTEWMFHDYIPQLKLKTYEAIQERNTKRYAKDLAAKRTTQGEIDYLSAQQTNAAYGHLNYADIGRNPTFQHIAQILLLAPDFLEARGRFAGQALTGFAGRAGHEQLIAIGTLALTQWMTARILNKTLDDDWHWDEPFSVVVGNRSYTMRSVPEDIYKLVADPRRFAMGRISPLVGKGIFQLGTGKNWRGEKVDYTDTFKELATAWIPIALRATPLGRSLTETDRANPISPWEQFIGSIGVHISRHSPIPEAFQLAHEYNQKKGIKEDTGTYPVSEYQGLRYALEDNDPKKAREELAKLTDGGKKNIVRGFRASLFHSYTGKDRAHEQAFRESLNDAGQHAVEKADTLRQKVWERFSELITTEEAQKPEPSPKKSASVSMERGKDGRVSHVVTEGDEKRRYTVERDPKTGRPSKLIPA